MTRFARLLTTEPAAFEDTDDYLFVSPENDSGADLDHLTLRRELAGAKNLLKAAEASKSEMLRLLSSLDRITDKRERHGENIHEAGAEANRHLLAIHHAFNKIAKGELGKTDVFANHLLSEMEKLAKVANEAAAKGLLHVKEHQFINSKFLLDAFGASDRVLRYTWRIDPSERLFADQHWRRHFELTSSLAISRSIKAIRVIFLIEQRSDLDAANVKKLLEFFGSQDGLAAKIVLNADYAAFAADHAIPKACIEFGVYADRLLYQAGSYSPVSVGSWSKDSVELQRFTRFFDSLWNAHTVAANNPASPVAKVTLSQLMAADEAAKPDAASPDSSGSMQFPGPV